MRGRPKKNYTMDKVFHVRMDEVTINLLNTLSDITQKSKSGVIRDALLMYYTYISNKK